MAMLPRAFFRLLVAFVPPTPGQRLLFMPAGLKPPPWIMKPSMTRWRWCRRSNARPRRSCREVGARSSAPCHVELRAMTPWLVAQSGADRPSAKAVGEQFPEMADVRRVADDSLVAGSRTLPGSRPRPCRLCRRLAGTVIRRHSPLVAAWVVQLGKALRLVLEA